MSVPNEELEVLVKKLNSKNKLLAKSFFVVVVRSAIR